MTRIGRAVALAAEIHAEQVDKSGVPYIFHVLAVRENLLKGWPEHWNSHGREDCEIVALLHDSLEDIDEAAAGDKDRLADKIEFLFGADVADAVRALTKYKGQPYTEYIDGVAANWRARYVKIADLSHNLDPFRLPTGTITERDFQRWNKYHKALVQLTAVTNS